MQTKTYPPNEHSPLFFLIQETKQIYMQQQIISSGPASSSHLRLLWRPSILVLLSYHLFLKSHCSTATQAPQRTNHACFYLRPIYRISIIVLHVTVARCGRGRRMGHPFDAFLALFSNIFGHSWVSGGETFHHRI